MSGRELDQHVLAGTNLDDKALRAAAVHVADRVAAEHPSPLDELMPKLAGRQLAQDQAVRDDVRDLLDALGLRTEVERLQGREVQLEAEIVTATAVNQQLKGGAS